MRIIFDRKSLPIIIIVLIAIFFRFYNYLNFQFWGADDEIMTATIRHMVLDKSPSLLIPNLFLEFGLGPFYYWILAPFFWITNFNLVLVKSIASIIGIFTVVLIYLIGKQLKDEKLGLVASLFYSSSLLVAFMERRLWPLSLGALMTTFSLFCLINIIRKKFIYFVYLAIPIGFSFHSDLSLLVIVIASCISLIYFKIRPSMKYLLYFTVVIAIFFSPFLLAEYKYDNSVSKAVFKTMAKPFRQETISPGYYREFTFLDSLGVFSRVIFLKPSANIEQNICHGFCDYQKPFLSPITEFVVTFLLLANFIFIKSKRTRDFIILLWIFIASFFFGLFIYNRMFGGNFGQNYFYVIFPVFFLIIALPITKLFETNKLIGLLLISVFVIINVFSLTNSSIRFPLYLKLKTVKTLFSKLDNNNYSLSIDSSQIDGGWTELFILNGQPPVSSTWFEYLEWLYKAYSLIKTSNNESGDVKTIVIKEDDENYFANLKLKDSVKSQEVEFLILEN